MDIGPRVGDENLVDNHKREDCEECKKGLIYAGNGTHITPEQEAFERSVVHLNYIARCIAQFPQ